MPRSAITCVYPNGDNFRCTRKEAAELIADNLAEWDGTAVLRLKPTRGSGGRLSCQVGAPLAVAVRRGESWARTALGDINR